MSATMYCIRVQAHLDDDQASWFEGMKIANEPGGEATLTGPVVDQAALHGLLNQVFSLNLTLISVSRVSGAPPGQRTDEPPEDQA
jgi:hypothetical protein